MAPKKPKVLVLELYNAGKTKEETRSLLKAKGWKSAHISQLLKTWPPAAAGAESRNTGAPPAAETCPAPHGPPEVHGPSSSSAREDSRVETMPHTLPALQGDSRAGERMV